MTSDVRAARPNGAPSPGPDTRKAFQIDRDRILYCSAFRRLAGITQVVGSLEGHVFHNRLTHTLKAAQIARRIAQLLLEEKRAFAHEMDPEVVEAAALAHDLGHPPFGHAAEEELDILVTKPPFGPAPEGGFEGNAQTFRILNKLACHRPNYLGLNLTRATLRAVVKYPNFRPKDAPLGPAGKWNAYASEKTEFEFALQGAESKSAEACVMELGDDIAYSVHDMEDFYRIGWMPLDLLFRDPAVVVAKISDDEWARDGLSGSIALTTLTHLSNKLGVDPPRGSYSGRRDQRIALRSLTSALIGRFLRSAQVSGEPRRVELASTEGLEVRVMKRVFGSYVYGHPALVAQQYGHRLVVRDLFKAFWSSAHQRKADKRDPTPPSRTLLPAALGDLLEHLESDIPNTENDALQALRTRVAADAVASLTEQEALSLHRRLTGYDKRTVHDRLVY